MSFGTGSTPPLFLTITYLHLFISTVITTASRVFPLSKSLYAGIAFMIVSIGILFFLLQMRPGPMKYVVFFILCLAIGQMFGPFDKAITEGNTIRNTLVMVAGIFGGMTILAFIDSGNFLGLGPYLFAGLLGMIIARLGLTFYAGEKGITEEVKTWDVWLSYAGTALFALYTAYDTQKLKEYGKSLGRTGKPDYVNASLDLYLDVLNLFVNVEDIVG